MHMLTPAIFKFQEIFVLNLPQRTDRRDAMTLAGVVSGVRFTWVDGVRGADVPEKALPPGDRSTNVKWQAMTGCWRAHMKALQQ